MPTLVVAALSARLLAQSARRAGWNVIALDLFGDVDTRAAASAWHAIGDPAELRIDGDRFLGALQAAQESSDCIGWIAGTGFEPRPDLLEAGARALPLLGSDRAVIDRVRNARIFFATLDASQIPHPETRFDAPDDARGWLMKDFATSGGWHIAPASARRWRVTQEAGAGIHFQRETPGRPMSVLFVATKVRARAIGISELLVRPHGSRPYVYHGAIGPIDLAPAVATQLSNTLEMLVRTFALRGLASLDFLLDAEKVNVLEINARPSSTMALYDAEFPAGLAKAHVDACAGTLPDLPEIGARRVRGELIVFATRAAAITREHVDRLFALACHDVPQPQSHIPAGAPLCSVSAHGDSVEQVQALLAQHEATALAIVQNRNGAQIHAG